MKRSESVRLGLWILATMGVGVIAMVISHDDAWKIVVLSCVTYLAGLRDWP